MSYKQYSYSVHTAVLTAGKLTPDLSFISRSDPECIKLFLAAVELGLRCLQSLGLLSSHARICHAFSYRLLHAHMAHDS